jgi:predicted aldo/keto reductase-like oxidoreductase
MDQILGLWTSAGGNYVDLLYVEEDYWDAFGALYKSYRDRLVTAAHWSSGPVWDLDFCRRTFENILAHLGNDHVEVALMTMIDEPPRRGDWLEASLEHLRRYQAQGRVGFIGGSAHDPVVAREIVETGVLDVLMFAVNMLDRDDETVRALRQACVEHGTALVAMKPYHGGTLFTIDGRSSGITPSQCLSYVFDQPAVACAVPGPRNVKQMRATLRYLEATATEKDYSGVVGNLREILSGQCTYCQHCLPCEEGIEIGWVIWDLDQIPARGLEQVKEWYAGFPVKASACVECGVCVERCPFDVEIIAKMREAVEVFEEQAA